MESVQSFERDQKLLKVHDFILFPSSSLTLARVHTNAMSHARVNTGIIFPFIARNLSSILDMENFSVALTGLGGGIRVQMCTYTHIQMHIHTQTVMITGMINEWHLMHSSF